MSLEEKEFPVFNLCTPGVRNNDRSRTVVLVLILDTFLVVTSFYHEFELLKEGIEDT